ncbi:TIGR02391 family protein [Corynebacterium suicordis]|uniref:TIGR02391 family protein n=2 Tax=Corynebacterium TaxID=1716 RepID=UPI0025965B8F|nr:TIGR02391 family protein [uncultured Corynebacterium sp.]
MNLEWSPQTVTALAKVIGETDNGISGSEISVLLHELKMNDNSGESTKWKRLDFAFRHSLMQFRGPKRIITFITKVMEPVNYSSHPELFETRQRMINAVLIHVGLRVTDRGEVATSQKANTLSEAARLTHTVREELARRDTHSRVLKYCEEEIFRYGYFHAILEAAKSVFDTLRDMTGLDCDGAALADAALSVKSGKLRINSLTTDTERNEQNGFNSFVKAVAWMYRNPTAHDPRLNRSIGDTELYEALTLFSIIHRRLDEATVR